MISINVIPKIDVDVLVVGSGPSGAATAARLASQGFTVRLADKKAFPRDKVCGDLVSSPAISELATLGVVAKHQFRQANLLDQASVYIDGTWQLTHKIPKPHPHSLAPRVIPRITLDNLILSAALDAGCVFLDRHEFQNCEIDRHGVTAIFRHSRTTKTIRSRLIIGADGSSSPLAHRLFGKSQNQRDMILAVRAYFSDVKGSCSEASLHFQSEFFPGYFWIFPTAQETANVGLGLVKDTIPQHNYHVPTLLKYLISSDTAIRERLGEAHIEDKIRGWPIPIYDPNRPLVADRTIFVGDAAGLINSLNGEGIQYALLSARLAARIAASNLVTDRLRARDLYPYQELIEKECGVDLLMSTAIINLIRNRGLNPIWLKLLRVIVSRAKMDKQYAELTAGMLVGTVPVASVLCQPVIVGTLQQLIHSYGIGGALKFLSNPRAHSKHTLASIASLAADNIGTTVQHPITTFTWANRLARSLSNAGIALLANTAAQNRASGEGTMSRVTRFDQS